ncbi:proactivator polypeptide, partial [Clonorchis sinensis]
MRRRRRNRPTAFSLKDKIETGNPQVIEYGCLKPTDPYSAPATSPHPVLERRNYERPITHLDLTRMFVNPCRRTGDRLSPGSYRPIGLGEISEANHHKSLPSATRNPLKVFLRGPLLSLIYVKHLSGGLSCLCLLFADDFKSWSFNTSALQMDVGAVKQYPPDWQLTLDDKKCIHTSFRKGSPNIFACMARTERRHHEDRYQKLAVLDRFPLEYCRLRGELMFAYALLERDSTKGAFTVDPTNTRNGHDRKISSSERTILSGNNLSHIGWLLHGIASIRWLFTLHMVLRLDIPGCFRTRPGMKKAHVQRMTHSQGHQRYLTFRVAGERKPLNDTNKTEAETLGESLDPCVDVAMRLQNVTSGKHLNFGSTLCDDCQKVVQDIRALIADNATSDAIASKLNAVICANIPEQLQNYCKETIKVHVRPVLDLINRQISPQDICALLGLCPKQRNMDARISNFLVTTHAACPNETKFSWISRPSARHPKWTSRSRIERIMSKMTDKPSGSQCVAVLSQIRVSLKNPSQQAKIKENIDREVCNPLPTFLRTMCNNAVNEHFDEMMEHLDKVDLKKVCAMFGMPPDYLQNLSPPSIPTASIPGVCEVCEMVVAKVIEMTLKGATEKQITEALDR